MKRQLDCNSMNQSVLKLLTRMNVEQKYVEAFIVSSDQSNERKQFIREWPQKYHELPLMSSPPRAYKPSGYRSIYL